MRKILFIPFLLPLLLSGCIPAAILAGATVGGAIVYDKRSLKTMHSDQHAANVAQYWINNDPKLKGHAHISVSVFNQVALLVGQAQTEELRQRAYKIVKKVKDVKRIYNAITIAGATSELQRTSDTWITGKVKTVLLSTPGLKSNDLKIVTENGVVYLMGSVSRQQADIATNAARRVQGVTKVVKVFEYT